jgi:hypothetical protein
MTPYEYLRRMSEPVPPWLDEFTSRHTFRRQPFLASRVVYYPGAGTDGHPVRLFGSTHCAHCFVYADYGLARTDVEAQLEHPRRHFRGYHSLARLNLAEHDLTPGGWIPHVHPGDVAPDRYRFAAPPFGFLEVLERDQGFDDKHGARRLALLFLGADGIAAYDALFCQPHSTSPFAVVIQDHGFGGNYDRFGRGGLLDGIASRCDAVPRWLLVAENTDPWDGFGRVPGVGGDPGGMHATPRFLYKRCDR